MAVGNMATWQTKFKSSAIARSAPTTSDALMQLGFVMYAER